MEGSSPIPSCLCPHCLVGWGPGRWPQVVPIPTRVSPLHLEPTHLLSTIPAPSLLGAAPRHEWSQGLPPLTQALGSTACPGVPGVGISPAGLGLPRGHHAQCPPCSQHTNRHEPPWHVLCWHLLLCTQMFPAASAPPAMVRDQHWWHLDSHVPCPGCNAAGDPPPDKLKEKLGAFPFLYGEPRLRICFGNSPRGGFLA